MQERAAVGLTLIETFWNFFCGKNGAKRCKRGKKGAKKGQKRGKKRVDYRSLLFSLMMFNTLKNK
ncbi:hypothetical protein L6X21_RS00260 [Escherichia coli]|uniref:hypothetical protein n=1 Tax=Escherichia coli TaxID=562 RepID=UPI0017C3D490|nr:hypothetical protein [Escherichia coli]EFM6508932.1 hypothetical protein [Escherichia coli]EKG7274992.1 hypothetical protein [Escherichia coli]MBM2949760.1 hypothetical protein [Escherichia coli]HBN1654366.1 hypothetical protein [Escherichia coli]HCO0478457.1 hypothetical protein [Escherichia coli]